MHSCNDSYAGELPDPLIPGNGPLILCRGTAPLFQEKKESSAVRSQGGQVIVPHLPRWGLRAGVSLAAMAFLFVASASSACAQRKPQPALTAKIDARTGDYEIRSRAPAWDFRGSVKSPVQNLARVKGNGRLGPFHALRFGWRWQGTPVTAEIRTYDLRPVALFKLTYEQQAAHPQLAFPDFTSLPQGLHAFSYVNRPFSPPQFSAGESGTPWLLFDEQANAAIISPANDFQVVTLEGDGGHRVAVRLGDAIQGVPAGYSLRSLLVVNSGIGDAFTSWGKALTAVEGVARPSNEADRSLRYLGYWTDNGATYYYQFDRQLGYAGTLEEEINHLRSSKIPVRYLQLDSWWYPKNSLSFTGQPLKAKNPEFQPARWNVFGGIWRYEASPSLFPRGLAAFHRKVDLPFVVHSRWMGQDSPYHRDYKIAGVAPVDARYWHHIAAYLRENGVMTYEQDWLNVIREHSGFDADLRAGDAFFDGMASAMRAEGLTMQYCMPEPSEMLQGSRYPNLTTVRVSDDKFVRARWHDFLFTSQFAGALGIWPWADVATSQDPDAMLLQTLSAGPVGFGDGVGQENRENLMQSAREDGALVKPDAPLVPVDSDYINEARGRHAPLLGYAYTRENGIKTAYVFAFARTPEDRGPVQFRAGDIGLHGEMGVYDYFAHRTTVVPAGGSFQGQLGNDDASYYVVAIPSRSGVALFGDKNKFAGMSRMRIAAVADTPRQLEATVIFARGEKSVTLHGYAAFKPKVEAAGGQASALQYDRANGEFEVSVSAAPGARSVSLASWEPPTRQVRVLLSRP